MILRRNWRDLVFWPVVFTIVALSFWQTTRTNDRLAAGQQSQLLTQTCTTEFLGRAFEVLNERTAIAPQVNQADKVKTRAEARLFGFIVASQARGSQPGGEADQHTIDEFNKRINDYFQGISGYLEVLGRIDIRQQSNPVPTKEEYQTCLKGDSQ